MTPPRERRRLPRPGPPALPSSFLRPPAGPTNLGPRRSRGRLPVLEPLADPKRDLVGFAGPQLQHRPRAEARCRAPGLQPSDDIDYGTAAIEKDRVDRKAHEQSVNREGRPDQEPCSGWKVLPPQQSARACQDRVCDLAALTDDPASVAANHDHLVLGRPAHLWNASRSA